MPKKKSRLKKKRKARKRRLRAGETMMQIGGGLAATSAIPYLFGQEKAGGQLLAGGLGLAGAGLGVSVLESVGEGLQRTGRRRRIKKKKK